MREIKNAPHIKDTEYPIQKNRNLIRAPGDDRLIYLPQIKLTIKDCDNEKGEKSLKHYEKKKSGVGYNPQQKSITLAEVS